jgi:hypothetical protein
MTSCVRCGKSIRCAAPALQPWRAKYSSDAELARLETERDAIEDRLVGLQRPPTEAGMAAPITRLAASAPILTAP